MTIQNRLKRSNIIMLIVPVCIAGILLLLGSGAALLLLEKIYLPRIGLTLQNLHDMGEQLEEMFSGLKLFVILYFGVVVCTLITTVGFINLYLTRSLFAQIQAPLDTLLEGVKRIQSGDLETPISYKNQDEFKSACDAVDEMASRLHASLTKQQEQEQKKQELIAGMSHDLKSPLTTIRAYTEALLDGITSDESTRQKYLQTIYARENELETLINRLFELAKLGADKYPAKLEEIPLLKTLKDLLPTCKPEALAVTFSKYPVSNSDESTSDDSESDSIYLVRADLNLIQRIFQNILDNSAKYGADHAVICVEEEAGNASTGNLLLTITDNGPGVPEQQLASLFEPFYRGSASRSTSGSGLGLSIVQTSMRQMGGSVRAESSKDGGLCITLIFPVPRTA